MSLIIIALSLVVGWLLGYVSYHKQFVDRIVEVSDTYIQTKKMTERSLKTQMAAKLANEIASSGCMDYIKEDDGVFKVSLRVIK